VITKAGNLKAQHIFHAVVPTWLGGSHKETEILAKCIADCFGEGERRNLKSIAFSSFTTNIIDGIPKEVTIRVLIEEARRFIDETPISKLKEIRYCAQDLNSLTLFSTQFKAL